MLKRWTLPNQSPPDSHGESLAVQILKNRGFSQTESAAFLRDDIVLDNPFDLSDMQKAVDRINLAIENDEKITIFGDYDCDGVTATYLLYTFLSSMGAQVNYYIPDRERDGYGINCDAVRRMVDEGTQLIITVDNGIAGFREADLAAELGAQMIVTDHHTPFDTLPNAFAVINPHRKDCKSRFKDLAGVGVAFKLATALNDCDYAQTLDQFAEIAAIGTVADIVPLIDENRAIVRYGLQILAHNNNNIGLRALMQFAAVNPEKIDAQSIAFGIAPRINAAGRLGSAALAVELLLSEDEETAQDLAAQMETLNRRRQEIEKSISQEIEQTLFDQPALAYQRILFLKNDHWNHGIIGISAARTLEKYGKPTFLLSKEGDLYRGSVRSMPDFPVFDALYACRDHLQKYGGHQQAGGFSVAADALPAFTERLQKYAKEYFDLMPTLTLTADLILPPNQMTVLDVAQLQTLEPFGAGNESPLFLLPNAVVEGLYPLSENKHCRLKLSYHGVSCYAVYFGQPCDSLLLQIGDHIDLIAAVSVNEYKGNQSVSIKVKDLRPTDFAQDKFLNAKNYYEKLRRKEKVDPRILAKAAPSREEIGKVYQYLLKLNRPQCDLDQLYLPLMKTSINYCKFRLIIDILTELELAAPSGASVAVQKSDKKLDLNDSKLFAALQKIKNA